LLDGLQNIEKIYNDPSDRVYVSKVSLVKEKQMFLLIDLKSNQLKERKKEMEEIRESRKGRMVGRKQKGYYSEHRENAVGLTQCYSGEQRSI
jgi:hypothetical protein